MGIDGDLNDEMKLDVGAIQENSQTLLHIINDILDLAKIEAGRMTFELSELDVHALMEDVIRNNASLVVNKPVEFMLDVEKKLPAITADAGRVTQILTNLVSNATKFTEEGSITLKAFAKGNEWVVMQVIDTGMGMNEEDLQVIFDEFTQADSSQTRTAEGTGLGLTITRRLVQMHGGEISVESEFGKGSTFTVKLPVATRISSEVTVKLASSNGSDAKANGSKGKTAAKTVANNK
jgi:signal transduction histidine kinase